MATYAFQIDWNLDSDFSDTGETVTSRVHYEPAVTVQYGRDQARVMSPIGPGEASFELNNRSQDYSPENGSSPLVGNILPARPVLIQATHSAVTYTLYRGYTDGFDVKPDPGGRRVVAVSCVDALASLREVKISTALYGGIRTGQAIGYVLDAAGWPTAARDLDLGATTIRWWWEEGTDAATALERLVDSEGPGALLTIDADGLVVFRDRHHRLLDAASTTSQVTFRDSGAEPKFSAPLVYDHGWRDVVNTVQFSVEERSPSGAIAEVFTSDDIFSVADGQTVTISAQGSDPFRDAAVPSEAAGDFLLHFGAVNVSLSRTSGQAVNIYVQATGGPAVIEGMKLRAYPLPVRRTVQVSAIESTSVSKYRTRSYSRDVPWAGVNDARAIVDLILARYAERLPIVTFRVASGTNGNSTRLLHQLARDLSDRVTVVEAQTGLSDDFFIERIEHTISEVGRLHETTFGCEKAPTPPASPFTFDVSGRGFNDGVFGAVGLDDPTTVFIFDHATQGKFDTGLLAT
jgi:hypothetical protein